MRVLGIVGAFVFGCWFCAACTSTSDPGQKTLSYPSDERVNLKPNLTLSALCDSNGHTMIVRFQTPQTMDQVLPLLAPVGGSLACEDASAQDAQAGKTCYIVRLGSGRCCGDGMDYFNSLTSPPTSTDVPDPTTPCSCETSWTLQWTPLGNGQPPPCGTSVH